MNTAHFSLQSPGHNPRRQTAHIVLVAGDSRRAGQVAVLLEASKGQPMKTTLSLAMITASIGTAALAQSVEISRSGERAGMIGPAETFVGTAYVEPVFNANEHRGFSAGEVTFLPG